MAELNTGGDGGKGGKVRSKKSNPGVDLTAMVDLAFLLITFFMLTTSLSKPQSMPLAMPDKTEQPDSDKDVMPIDESRLMTILIGKDNTILWYVGKFTEPKVEPTQSEFGKEGIRKVLLEQIARAKAYVKRDGGKPDEHLIVNIKASDKASYRNLVDILDEMAITHPQLYAIGDITEPEVKLLEEKGLL
ncbi:biopolymer transporter ExbD [Flavobacterium arcticum]|uniref:Biopolymer transporter ExbD n=1 Tax=Flavobacterium arcticum TaxID=1784713 RepID=A0A345HCF9_9FLAO|nr:biopolymer transporter ExbD [Flavobacterium arcticum]AXG74269.1 biopolymer transporter ExbD [Flavobacterium arcticum]KAF2508140.1 biopolymer transporter ExbD [Flavobacterium arcticum]